ncbi:MAG: UDP-N-acetylmuramate dehydrogenase [Alphaproteobacteria bacterium]|nr:UDP-N-acetylmuramate dehydrogenase [Alphaproteobacteria bacterium]MCY4229822.1 UDP-N-acetylmuramate dehydrogenase [Alphaproteobacteria bacterium]MCY4318949.1 UDP-N-acetylmuramate dehydrogenase [Alphaproteobacteria bacterium]
MIPRFPLPCIRGRISASAPLDRIAWFGVGGPAEAMARPVDRTDLEALLAQLPHDVPLTVLGVTSNTLIRDGGVEGLVMRLGRGFAGIRAEGETIVAGGAALCTNVARAAADAGIGGLEFLSGIPGTVGGALAMNAGAYGRETADVLLDADVMMRRVSIERFVNDDFAFRYRGNDLDRDCIFLSARFQGAGRPSEAVRTDMAEIASAREASQPIRTRTGGSTFRNPAGARAWELIDQAGCRGLRRGGAMVSEMHCNFLVNTGSASAADLEDLGEDVRARVCAATGINLDWEIERIGRRGAA